LGELSCCMAVNLKIVIYILKQACMHAFSTLSCLWLIFRSKILPKSGTSSYLTCKPTATCDFSDQKGRCQEWEMKPMKGPKIGVSWQAVSSKRVSEWQTTSWAMQNAVGIAESWNYRTWNKTPMCH
jgi:hypothetical protein